MNTEDIVGLVPPPTPIIGLPSLLQFFVTMSAIGGYRDVKRIDEAKEQRNLPWKGNRLVAAVVCNSQKAK